jgi:acyl carrier protein
MSTPITKEALTAFVSDKLLAGQAITSDENLLLSGLVDSLGVMTLVAHLEEVTSDKIPMEDVILENFASVDAILSYLGTRP